MIIKNSNLREDLFSNRYKILWIIIAIILVLCLIQIINKILINQETEKRNTLSLSETSTNTSTNTESSYKPEKTIIQGEDVTASKQKSNNNIMDSFIKYCNEKNVESAYNMLTNESKKIFFNSNINQFKQDYIDKIFTTKKIYSMQSWMQSGIGYTYKVRILDDMLATGSAGDVVEGYYTIVEQDGEYKLNLNSYIGKQELNAKESLNGITIEVISKQYFMDYETYIIKVQNNTTNKIILDTKQNAKSVYLTGSNNGTYTGYMFEIDDVLLTINSGLYRTYNIRFNKMYDAKTGVKSITFSDIVLNADEYNNSQNKKDYTNRAKIEVNL